MLLGGALILLVIVLACNRSCRSGFSGEKVWYETRGSSRPGAGYRTGFRSGPSCAATDTKCSCHSGCYCRRSGECPTHPESKILSGSAVVAGLTTASYSPLDASEAFAAGAMCGCCSRPVNDCSCPANCQCRLDGQCPHSRG